MIDRLPGTGAKTVREKGLVRQRGQRRGEIGHLCLSASCRSTQPQGDGPDGRVGSSISDFLLSFPPSLSSGSWQSFYSTFLLSAPAKGRGCEGPHSLGWRIGCLAKEGLFPFPALNLLVASREAEKHCVGTLRVMGRRGDRQGTLPGPRLSWSWCQRIQLS